MEKMIYEGVRKTRNYSLMYFEGRASKFHSDVRLVWELESYTGTRGLGDLASEKEK